MDVRIQPLAVRRRGAERPVARRSVAAITQNNYGGAVKRLNAIRAQLARLRVRRALPASSSTA